MANLTQTVTVIVVTPGATPTYPETPGNTQVNSGSTGYQDFLVNEGPTLVMQPGHTAFIKAFGSFEASVTASTDAAAQGNPNTPADRLLASSEVLAWSVSNTAVASLSATSGNPINVTGVAAGTATVTVTYNNDMSADQSLSVEVGSPS